MSPQSQLSSPAKAGDPVFQSVSAGAETARRTESPGGSMLIHGIDFRGLRVANLWEDVDRSAGGNDTTVPLCGTVSEAGLGPA
jgi:hypothetical protein